MKIIKRPKEVTLNIISQEPKFKLSRKSSLASIDTSRQLHDMNTCVKVSEKSLRPSTSRDSLFSDSIEMMKYFKQTNSTSKSRSNQSSCHVSGSCRHSKCGNESMDRPVKNNVSEIKCFEKVFYKITNVLEGVHWDLSDLSYANIIILLKRLSYVHYESEKDYLKNNSSAELKKIYIFWQYLTAECQKATLLNFLILVCHIQNIRIDVENISRLLKSLLEHLKSRNLFETTTKQSKQPEYKFMISCPQIRFNNSQMSLDGHQIAVAQKEFKCFLMTRLNTTLHREFSEEKPRTVELSHKTHKLAQLKRNKIIAIIKSRKTDIKSISLSDILSFKSDVAPINKLEEPLKVKNSNKPKTYMVSINLLAQPKTVIHRQKQELQYERNIKQCTFKPHISHKIHIRNQPEAFKKIKNVNKSIDRIREGRLHKDQKQRQLQKGWTNTAKQNKQPKSIFVSSKKRSLDTVTSKQLKQAIDSVKNLMYEQQDKQNDNNTSNMKTSISTVKSDTRIPLLFVDVNIDEQTKQRIVIYEQDKSETLAHDFAVKHGLDNETELKLKQLIDYQISSVLTKIEEQLEEEDQ